MRRQVVWTYLARSERNWDKLPKKDISRIVDLLEHNLQEEPYNDKDLRLWVQAVRRQSNPPSLESFIERVGYWKANAGTLDAIYYLYIAYCLLASEGSSIAREEAIRYIEECRNAARTRRNRTISFEWLGESSGVSGLVHHSELGEWIPQTDFWQSTHKLARLAGRIVRIDAPQAGLIEIDSGITAFFVPARGGFSRGRSENQTVDFCLGFSYDGLRAWEVKKLE